MAALLIQAAYLVAAILFILGLKALSSPATARRGMFLAEAGMFFAVVGTLLDHRVITYEWILIGMVIGSTIGAVMAIFMPMTAMPQRIALSHAFGALAAVLVGIVKYTEYQGEHGILPGPGFMAAIGFEVFFGALTVTGSLMAFGKLQELIQGAPITYKGQNFVNIGLFFATLGLFGYLIFNPSATNLFFVMIALGLAIGVMIVMPIGGADMPVVVSLLNSYAGLAASATGFAIDNKVLIIAGALDGASGFFLSILMSRAMNRSFTNVLFGAVGAAPPASAAATGEQRTVVRYTPEDATFLLENSQSVIIVPGYGMAVAQAQHILAELGDLLTETGVQVRYAIHPVAGRMPGHMNVLLAEADVPYDVLLEMDHINDDFANTDAVIVVGANDVVNPSARYKKDSPLYGMPILNADKARNIIILKRSLKPGFAGEDNELFYDPKTMMVFGDAKQTLTHMVQQVKKKVPA
ncbi:MAG: NAD(P)(+) transhydrogenase (Re/Si-specific) subunit beta [Chloroflexales bacterium]|nr:NAD(P)(+) transhydrogenase (Re/Si-specific) subunit beta [Chloroflexales bacterium]